MAFAGRLDFNPVTDSLTKADGTTFKFEAPKGDVLPAKGFLGGLSRFVAPMPAATRTAADVVIDAKSERLERLTPFPAFEGKDPEGLVILLKAVGKCTTDHISPAGPWLTYRGHLTNISRNMFLTAQNAFVPEAGKAVDQLHNNEIVAIPELAFRYRKAGQGFIVIGDQNYGEGSSREHAAMEPRAQGCRAVIVRSFARIHETNLKKQGLLPLTFVNPADYDKARVDDRVALRGVSTLAPGSIVTLELRHADGTVDHVPLKHTMNDEQIEWFVAGSALNKIRAAQG
jgi:aconitate hydratase